MIFSCPIFGQLFLLKKLSLFLWIIILGNMKNLKRYILMIMVSLMFCSFSGCLPEDTTGDKEAVEAEDNQNNSRV